MWISGVFHGSPPRKLIIKFLVRPPIEFLQAAQRAHGPSLVICLVRVSTFFFKLERSIPHLNDTSRFTVRLYLFWSPNFIGDFVAQLKLECFDFLLSIATWNLEILIFLMGLNNFVWIVCGLSCTHKKKFILCLKNFYIFGGTVRTARKFIFIFFCRFWFFITVALTSHNVGQSECSDYDIFKSCHLIRFY